MKVADAMSKNVITANTKTTVRELAKLLTENGIGGIPVVDSANQVLGIVTERDLLPKLKGVPFARMKLPTLFGEWIGDDDYEKAIAEAKDKHVEEVMNTDVLTVEAEEELGAAVAIMAERGIKRLPVLQGKVLVGILTRADVIRSIASSN